MEDRCSGARDGNDVAKLFCGEVLLVPFNANTPSNKLGLRLQYGNRTHIDVPWTGRDSPGSRLSPL